MSEENRLELSTFAREWLNDLRRESGGYSSEVLGHINAQAAQIERLREVVTFPIITPEAPSTLHIRILAEHEKGLPVNAQDLINALMWRVKNQREQLARLNRRVEEYRSDD
jgi:hypothetical protein